MRVSFVLGQFRGNSQILVYLFLKKKFQKQWVHQWVHCTMVFNVHFDRQIQIKKAFKNLILKTP